MADEQESKKRRLRKRGHGEGSIRQRADGMWRGTLMLGRRLDGKPDVRYVYGKTRTECQLKLDKLRRTAQSAAPPAANRFTLGEYLEQWLRDAVKPSVRPRTYESYDQQLHSHIIPALGRTKLTALRPDSLQKYYATKIAAGLSPTSVKYHHAIIHRALKQALKWDLVSRNVAESVDAPRPRSEEMRFLLPGEVSKLIEVSDEAGDRLLALWALAIYSGARQGELLALRWSDIDLESGRVRITRALERTSGGVGVYAEPKTASSRRTITLDPDVVAILREHMDRQKDEKASTGAEYDDQGLVFCTQIGRPLIRFNVVRDFKNALARAGLPPIRFHDLRHTNGVLMQLSGVGIRAAMGRLGHSQARTTLETYGHITPDMDIDAATRIAATIRGGGKVGTPKTVPNEPVRDSLI